MASVQEEKAGHVTTASLVYIAARSFFTPLNTVCCEAGGAGHRLTAVSSLQMIGT